MHELGVTQSILDITLNKGDEAQASKVTEVNLVVGELSGFVPDCIEFYFNLLNKGTIAEGAILHFELIPAQLKCRKCATLFHPKDTEWVCPKCQSPGGEVVQGKELYIESIEAE